MGGNVTERSKLLFNSSHMLSVAHAVGEGDEVIDTRTLQDRLQLSQSSVRRVLVALEGVGLMDRMERQTRTEPLRYRRRSHPFWLAARELANA